MRRTTIARLLLLLVPPACYGQSFTATILGSVKDSTGAMVPDASVTVVHLATNKRAETKSDAAGLYVIPQLTPGAYRIEASATGFKKFVQEGVVLQVQQQARVGVILSVGDVTESVMVTAEAPLLESTTSSVGRVVDNRRIRDLPLNTRNVYSLIFLTAGVSGSVGNQYNSLSYSINGARSSMMDTIIDGVTASFPTVNGFTGISVFPSVDAIEEFRVQGSHYNAEFGRSLGSVLNVVFKSGANQIHGSAFEFLRNSKLDANDFFSSRRGQRTGQFQAKPVRRNPQRTDPARQDFLSWDPSRASASVPPLTP